MRKPPLSKTASAFVPIVLCLCAQWMICIESHAQQAAYYAEGKSYSNEDTTAIMQMVRNSFDIAYIKADSALPVLQQALNLSHAKRYPDGAGMSLYGLGLVYSEMNRNDTALQLYKSSFRYLKKSAQYQQMVPAVYSNMGYIYYFKGDYSKAILYLDSAVRFLSAKAQPESKKFLAITLNTIAAIYMRMGRAQVSLQYLLRVEAICRENNFTNQLAMVLGNKGEIYTELKDYPKAELQYRDALNTFQNDNGIEATALQATIKSGYANLKLKQGKPQEAIGLLKEVENQHNEYRKENTAIVPNFTMGAAYLQLKQYRLAENYLLKALKESEELNVKDNLNDIHRTLSELYDATGHYKQALYHYKVYEALKDSLLNNEKAKDISEIDAKYRVAEKNRDIAGKQLQISKQETKLRTQQSWIAGITAAALLLILFFISRSRNNKQKQKIQAKQIHILQQQQTLNQQQQQINHLKDIVHGEEKERVRIARELHDGIISQLMGVKLHFKAALQNAGPGLTDRADFYNTLQYLDDATKELRKTAHNFMPEAVLQGGLLQALHIYCEKMSIASGARIYFQHFGAAMPRDADLELSVYRIIQELIQNALKHAHCRQILVELNIEQHLLSIDVEDDGIGMDEAAMETTSGMGLKSIYTRVQALQGSIDISSEPLKGTSISMEFMLKETEDK